MTDEYWDLDMNVIVMITSMRIEESFEAFDISERNRKYVRCTL